MASPCAARRPRSDQHLLANGASAVAEVTTVTDNRAEIATDRGPRLARQATTRSTGSTPGWATEPVASLIASADAASGPGDSSLQTLSRRRGLFLDATWSPPGHRSAARPVDPRLDQRNDAAAWPARCSTHQRVVTDLAPARAPRVRALPRRAVQRCAVNPRPQRNPGRCFWRMT